MKKALVDERDMFLAFQLQLAATLVPRGENAVYTQRVRESRNSLASVEQQLTNCKHELDNFKKIKSKDIDGDHDQQIAEYEFKLENLQNYYNKMHQKVILDTENLANFSKQSNSNEDSYGPSVVSATVIFIGKEIFLISFLLKFCFYLNLGGRNRRRWARAGNFAIFR